MSKFDAIITDLQTAHEAAQKILRDADVLYKQQLNQMVLELRGMLFTYQFLRHQEGEQKPEGES